jgi:uncharacterized protein YwlG (UPF0340 family)
VGLEAVILVVDDMTDEVLIEEVERENVVEVVGVIAIVGAVKTVAVPIRARILAGVSSHLITCHVQPKLYYVLGHSAARRAESGCLFNY